MKRENLMGNLGVFLVVD